MQVKASCQMDVDIRGWNLQPGNTFLPPVWVCEEEKGDNQQVKPIAARQGKRQLRLCAARESEDFLAAQVRLS